MKFQLRYPSVWLGCLLMLGSPTLHADKPAGLSSQSLTTPSGPTSLKGLGESFSPNIAQGSGSYSVPLAVPPGFLAPELALSYNSGSGKSEVGMGFKLPRFFVYRSTDKGLPEFNEDDRFAVSGPQLNDELVLVNASQRHYRLKNEGAFALFIRHPGTNSWEIKHANGETTYLGESNASRQFNGQGAYRWYSARHTDRFNHEVTYDYMEDAGHVYLAEIFYQLHAPSDYQNRIVFNYENRPDAYTDYTYGAADTVNQRLSGIEMFHGNRLMRTYGLVYQNEELYSLLASVTLEGEDGLSLPTLSFEYAQHSAQGRPLITMNSTPNSDGLLNGRATLDDVNGDGLPDILYGDANNYHYYENLDGYTWSPTAISLSGSPDKSLQDSETLLADINGDGFRDVVYKYGDQFRFYPAGEVVEGQFLGFEASETLTTYGTPNYHWGLNTVKISDLNKDGRTDMLYQPSANSLKRVINDKANVLQEDNITSLPLDVSFTDPKISMTDFNGDGHLDFVKKDINYSSSSSGSRIRVWFGLGRGAYASEQEMGFVPTGDPNEYHLQDVNKDGQTDLIRISGSWVTYYLNTGRMTFTSAKGDFYGNPTSSQTQTVLFGDMNGNTTTDVVWVMNDGKIKYLDMMIAPYMGLLTKVDNGMGAVTTMTYKSSTDYMIEAKNDGAPWKTPLRTPIQVLQSLETTDSLDVLGYEANTQLIEYIYRDGYYDGKEREFRGFAHAKAIEYGDAYQETKITNTFMHVGRNLQTGMDEELLKGKAYLVNITDIEGQLIRSSEAAFEQRWLCAEDDESVADILPSCAFVNDPVAQKDDMIAMALPLWTLTGHWEKSTSPKWVLEEMKYDLWGNVVQTYKYGEVLFDNPGRALLDPFDIADLEVSHGADEIVTESAFIYNVEEWLIGQPYEQKTYDLSGELKSHTRDYFDGDAFEGLPLGQISKGLITKETLWIKDASGERWVNSKRSRFTEHGKLAEVYDANLNREYLDYDTATGFFVSAERKEVEGDILEISGVYDTGHGQIISSTGYNGLQREFVLDGLGRLSAWIEPSDSFEQPTTQYTYTYGTPQNPIATTLIEELFDREEGTYRRKWLYSDGFGRKRLEKVQAEDAIGYAASSWIRIGARGFTTHTYGTFASNTVDFEAPPDSMMQFKELHVDPLNRVVRKFEPQVTSTTAYQETQYYPLETYVYDERDTSEGTWSFPSIIKNDGLNRVKKLDRYTGHEGSIDVLTWNFEYDVFGNITSWADPEGNERNFTYDSRSKRLSVDDPNAGYYEFIYDDHGNEIRRIDPQGQVLEKEFGSINRIKKLEIKNQANGDPDHTFTYYYDKPSSLMPDANNLKGFLSYVEGPVNTRFFSYSVDGRIEKERHDLWDGVSPFENQNRMIYENTMVYTPGGFVKSRTLPNDITINYGYNERHLPDTINVTTPTETISILEQATYDPEGRFTGRAYGNNTVTCRVYNAKGLMSHVRAGRGDLSKCDTLAQFDLDSFFNVETQTSPEGLITSVTDLSPIQPGIPRLDATYDYDRLSQLLSTTTPDYVINYEYDRLQNLTQRDYFTNTGELQSRQFSFGQEGLGPNQMHYDGDEILNYDANGHLEQMDGYDFLYDGRGRMSEVVHAEKGNVKNYYDHQGQLLIHIESPAYAEPQMDFYVFDAFGIRAGEPTYWVEGGGGRIAEVTLGQTPKPDLNLLDELIAYHAQDEAGLKPLPASLLDWNDDASFDDLDVAHYASSFWDAAAAQSGEQRLVVKYLHPDLLDNASYVTDQVGDLVHHATYLPFGEKRSGHGVATTLEFGGSLTQANLGLQAKVIGARLYVPGHGRWTSPDELFVFAPRQVAEDVMQSNPYAYVSNNPILYIDSFGFYKIKVEAGVGVSAEAWGGGVAVYALLGYQYDSNSSGSRHTLTGRAGFEAKLSDWWSYKKEVSFSVPLDFSGFEVSMKTSAKVGKGPIKLNAGVKTGMNIFEKIKIRAENGIKNQQRTQAILKGLGGVSLSGTIRAGPVKAKISTTIDAHGNLTFMADGEFMLGPVPAKVVVSVTLTPEELEDGLKYAEDLLKKALSQGADATKEADRQNKAANKPKSTYRGSYGTGLGLDCFLAGTQIAMADDTFKNIEDIEVGDLVWAWDDAEKALSAQKVTKTFVHENEYDLLILNDLVYVTPNHPIYLDGDWVPAGDLESGDILITVSLGKEGHNLFERRLKSITQYENHVGKVYNFKVEKLHNYFADGILVHNKPP